MWALRPAKPLGVLSRHPCRNPKPLSPWEGLCMLGWLCVLQSLVAYTPGIRAGAILLGLPPLDQARMLAVSRTKPLHDAVVQMADDLYGGFATKQGCFGCLPKVLHDAKPAEQATLDTPFLIFTRGFSTVCNAVQRFIHLPAFFRSLSSDPRICRKTSCRPSAPAT